MCTKKPLSLLSNPAMPVRVFPTGTAGCSLLSLSAPSSRSIIIILLYRSAALYASNFECEAPQPKTWKLKAKAKGQLPFLFTQGDFTELGTARVTKSIMGCGDHNPFRLQAVLAMDDSGLLSKPLDNCAPRGLSEVTSCWAAKEKQLSEACFSDPPLFVLGAV